MTSPMEFKTFSCNGPLFEVIDNTGKVQMSFLNLSENIKKQTNRITVYSADKSLSVEGNANGTLFLRCLGIYQIRPTDSERDEITDLALTTDNKFLLVKDETGKIRLFDLTKRKQVDKFQATDHSAEHMRLFHATQKDGKREILVALCEKVAFLFDATEEKMIGVIDKK